MSEIIYRQDAVKALYRRFPTKTMEECAMMLQEVPSAEPERKKGKWIDDKCSACGYKCSACGYRVEPWNNTPYCPSCGAYMRGEQDE